MITLFPAAMIAQQTTVINRIPADTAGKGLVPVKTTEHRVIINYYEPASSIQMDRFQELVSSYLDLYIDQCVVTEKSDVKLRKNKKETLRDLNSIVQGVLEFYDYQQLKNFKGFSKLVENKLEGLDQLDFSRTSFAAGAKDEEDKKRMEQFYLQKELSDLKLLVNMEIGIYGDKNLLIFSSSEETIIDGNTKERLLAEFNDYDPKKPLSPIKVKLNDESMAMIQFRDTSSLDPQNSDSNPVIPGDEFSMQVLKLLQANNDKLDGMQKQIDDLRTEQVRMWQAQQDEKNLAMQKQIDDLRQMVFALVQMNSGDAVATSDKNSSIPDKFGAPVLSNIPKSMNIYFAKSSVALDATSKLSLNEVVDILARDPQIKLIITGYADKSGNETQNLIISQQRANSVKKFLAESGLGQDRFITKYFGDRDSQTVSATDRKVVVEFVR